jgi:hypothetical protein
LGDDRGVECIGIVCDAVDPSLWRYGHGCDYCAQRLTFVAALPHLYRAGIVWAAEILFLVAVWYVSLLFFSGLRIIDGISSARCARVSIGASILRFLLLSRDKLLGRFFNGLLLSMGGGLLFGKIYQCGHDLSWEKGPFPFCPQSWSLVTVGLLCRSRRTQTH